MESSTSKRKRQALKHFMEQQDLNIKKWSEMADMSPNTLYSFMNGKSNDIRYTTLEKLASAAGANIPSILGEVILDSQAVSSMPVRGLASCGVKGWFNSKETESSTERPAGLQDSEAFAVLAQGDSMKPEGILHGQLALCSPAMTAESGDAVYIEQRDGTASIKLFKGMKPDWLIVTGWLPVDEDGEQKVYTEEIRLNNVTVLAPVIYVKRK